MMKRRATRWSVLAVVLVGLIDRHGPTQSADANRALLTAETRAAIDRGLAYLVQRQLRSGAFGRDARAGNAHPGVTALAGMAFLAAGSTAVRGPYRNVVNRITDYLVSRTDAENGLIRDTITQAEPMYSHTFATLYLAEVCGEDRRPAVRRAVKRAADLIIRTQRDSGGWRYRPTGNDADVSVTACALVALKGARIAGVRVPAETIRRAVQYVLACAKSDGSFKYQAEGGHATFQLTAAATTALFAAGVYEGPETRGALGYLLDFRADRSRPILGHFFYGHYYAIQAAYHARGEYFRGWYEPLRDKLLRDQDETGRWRKSTVGDVYATAMAVLILSIPHHKLPIFVR